MPLLPATPPSSIDVPTTPTATNNPSADLDDDSLVLNRDQLRQIQQFRDDIRTCHTDDEKYEICARIRDDLLDQHTGLEFLVAAFHHVMLDECADYEEWKAGGTSKSKRQTRRKADADAGDAAQWERFVQVAQKGSSTKTRCLRALNTVGRFWGCHRVQHYEWGSKGTKYCEVLCSAAHAVHDWDEAVTKLCWIILQRLRRPGSRDVRCSVNPIDQIDLISLKAWSHNSPFVNPKYPDEEPLSFRPLAASDLPDGFGFDQFLLVVRSEYAVQSVEPSTAAATMLAPPPAETDPDTTDISPSTPDHADTREPQPPAASPVASLTESALDTAMIDIVDTILAEGREDDANESDRDPRDRLDGAREDPPDITQTELPIHTAMNGSAAVDPSSAKHPGRELRPRTQKPDYRAPAPAPASSKPKQTSPKSTTPAQRRCCPPDVPTDFLSVLDKPSAFRVEVVEKYAPYLKKLCHKHLQKSAELAFAQKRDYPVRLTDLSNANPLSATGSTTIVALDILPIPTRRRATSEPDISHELPPFKRQRLDAPNLPLTDPRDRPLHDCTGDHAYLEQSRTELLEYLDRSQVVANSHGKQDNRLVYTILEGILQPNTDENKGTVEAYFSTAKEATSRLESGFPDGPIFAQAQQQFQWRDQDRPIVQLFRRMEDLDRTVSVRIPSRSSTAKPSDKRKLSQVYSRFVEQKVTDDPWSILHLRSPLPPSILPSFLTGENCQLLLHIRDALLMGGATASPELWNEWRDVLDSVLLMEGGHNIPPQINNLATWITVQEGRLGFAWMSRPTQEEQDEWMADPRNSTAGPWRYVILKPGQTVAFNSGTIFFTFSLRDEQTLALRGHFLQWTGVDRWLQVVNYQMSNGNTNDDLKWSAPNYVRVVESLVKKRQSSGRVEELGGEAVIARFFFLLEKFKIQRPRRKGR